MFVTSNLLQLLVLYLKTSRLILARMSEEISSLTVLKFFYESGSLQLLFISIINSSVVIVIHSKFIKHFVLYTD